MGIKPIGNKVLVTFVPWQERKTAAGILVPDPKHEGVPHLGRVLAISDAVGREGIIQVGQLIEYNEPSPEGFHWKGQKIILVKRENIDAIHMEE